MVNQSYDKNKDVINSNFQNNYRRPFVKQGSNQQFRQGNQKAQATGGKYKGGMDRSSNELKCASGVKPQVVKKGSKLEVPNDSGMVQKPALSTKYNENFKPKVLVRGSGSNDKLKGIASENIPIANSFQAFEDHDMVDKEEEFNKSVNDEYDKTVWPMLKKEMDSIMKSGIYPSLKTRTDWSLSQLDYFYKNCSNYGMGPYMDDDDDV